MSCGVGHRHGFDPTLLWLWYRPAATTLIQPLAWESPYAKGAALKRKKEKKDFPYVINVSYNTVTSTQVSKLLLC